MKRTFITMLTINFCDGSIFRSRNQLLFRHWDHVPHVNALRAYFASDVLPHLSEDAKIDSVESINYELLSDGTMKVVREKSVYTPSNIGRLAAKSVDFSKTGI
jgi:hypothetical protein